MSTRERIIDAAAAIMRERGIVKATTKAIAREAGCSEALLYRHFPGKHELFMAVLNERLPRPLGAAAPGEGTVHDNLVDSAAAMVAFFREGFPIAAALFGERELLAGWRDGVTAAGGGPRAPRDGLTRYLAAERDLGRVPDTVDPEAVAAMLVGAAFHEAFLASFEDRAVDGAESLASAWVSSLGL